MKTLGALILAGGLALPTLAHAQDSFFFKPYVGLDFQRTHVDYSSEDLGGGATLDYDSIAEDNLNGFNIHVGNRFNQYFGAELGYFHTRDETRNVTAGDSIGSGTVAATDFTTEVRMQGVTLDALGYLPVTDDGQIELIGTAGLSWTKAKASINIPGVGNFDSDEDEIGVRFGGGAQVNITDNINLRGLVRYQTADFENVADSAWTYSLGVNYSF